MKILFGRTIEDLLTLASERKMPIRPTAGWRYLSETQGVNPWIGLGSVEVFGRVTLDPAILYEWWLRGIRHEAITADAIAAVVEANRKRAEEMTRIQAEVRSFIQHFEGGHAVTKWPPSHEEKIAAIKRIRIQSGAGLFETKDAYEEAKTEEGACRLLADPVWMRACHARCHARQGVPTGEST